MRTRTSSQVRPHGWKVWVPGIAIVGAACASFAPFAGAAGAVSPTVPGAPAITSVTPGNFSINVVYTAPASDGGSHIFSYSVTCTSSNGGTTRSETEHSSPTRVDGLTPGKSYTCSVTARNRVGSGPASVASAAVIVLPNPPPTVPGAPAITSVTPGDRSISVVYTAPASDGGDKIFAYSVTCTSSNGGTTRSETEHSSPTRVDGLTPGKTYACSVTARNRVGSGPASVASSAVIVLPNPPPTVPGAPSITSATAGVQSVTVAFTPPASDGGEKIFDYKATCTSSDGGVTHSDDGRGSPVQVRHLTASKTYTCTVAARNREGLGAASGPSSAVVTLAPPVVTAPGAPTITSVTAGHRSITVVYTAPAVGVHIFLYRVTCTSSNGGVTRSVTEHSSPTRVDRLTGGKTYTCTVTARNQVGEGPPSAPSSAVVTLS